MYLTLRLLPKGKERYVTIHIFFILRNLGMKIYFHEDYYNLFTYIRFNIFLKALTKVKTASNKKKMDNDFPFQSLPPLPVPLSLTQCVAYDNEILICGGYNKPNCYSYHVLQNEYKLICSYPIDIKLEGHCVIKIGGNIEDDTITLLSFGGQNVDQKKHTLVMKYMSVWKPKRELNGEVLNQWIPLIHNGKTVIIGRKKDHLQGVRGIIGGKKGNLLFLTHWSNKMDVIDLNTYEYITTASKNELPIPRSDHGLQFHCFVSPAQSYINGRETSSKTEMLLISFNVGLHIIYDEDTSSFVVQQLPVSKEIASFNCYAYIRVDHFIVFFGGYSNARKAYTSSVYTYSIRDKAWAKCTHTLPQALGWNACVMAKDNKTLHVLGGFSGVRALPNHFQSQIDFFLPVDTNINQHSTQLTTPVNVNNSNSITTTTTISRIKMEPIPSLFLTSLRFKRWKQITKCHGSDNEYYIDEKMDDWLEILQVNVSPVLFQIKKNICVYAKLCIGNQDNIISL
ncbi:hypothetical protein RFI_28603 [Reticulomyxa filosa]|uniref:Kelch motif family protein n=1 Tax=Reticulomyxa filosa TaxID=46433 RepID=X6M460_RETFI|nr:hypothetical protein RFI_28603 [Reticulomyxa filosa]|eukprot:ETO08783.1 hypothetical protein RFI_28603 [Reticulomyxa filosa]